MLSRVPSWVLLVAGLAGLGLQAASGLNDDPHTGFWYLTWLLGIVLMILGFVTYADRRGWTLRALLRKRRERR
jgi:uncharacterized membrane protein HdeD (DUF308 family)